ncbi:MAG: adenylate/guanylate cyclase domain-containing protein [Desulfobulbaceae bacterium]|nr:adenylate/guanylate cyclase domain-containing protein [Desulfobulbaceae bacterium]
MTTLNEQMAGRSFRLSWQEVLLHSVAGILFSLLLWFSGLLDGIEADTFDLRVNLHAAPTASTSSIVFVRVDQESLDHMAEVTGETWPWPREFYAAVINNCRRRGALAIGFDVIFTEPSRAGVNDDQYLRRAMEETANFALGSVFATRELHAFNTEWPPAISRPSFKFSVDDSSPAIIPSYPRATFPLAEIVSSSALLSNVQHQPDPDGIYRRLHPFVMFDGEPLPSLGIAMYLAAHKDAETIVAENTMSIDGKKIPVDDSGMVLLNYRGPSSTFPYLHASSLIFQEMSIEQGLVSPDEIKMDLQGKYVLFGFTARALYDAKTSPIGKISGPEINATMLDNLLSEDFIHPLSIWWMISSVMMLTFLSSFFISILPSFRSHIFSAAMFLLLPAGIAVIAYRSGYNYTFVPVQIAVVTGTAFSVFRAYFIVHGQEEFIRHSFTHYLSPVVIDQLIRNPELLKLGGERKELSLFFSDLEGFTKISEGLAPEELTRLLNEYLTAMTDIILEEEGTVDKFEGDAIIAFWNAPLDVDNHAEKAVRTALRCQEKLDELRPCFLDKYGKELFMRIGINTGSAIAGNMGSSSRFDYTVLGDAVNLAARLEGANKYYGTYTMISSSTFDQLGDSFYCRELGRLRVVGRKEPVTVYEPISWGRIPERNQDFNRGLDLFYMGDFTSAFEVFKSRENEDPAARAYCAKCQELQDMDIEAWTGVWELDSK